MPTTETCFGTSAPLTPRKIKDDNKTREIQCLRKRGTLQDGAVRVPERLVLCSVFFLVKHSYWRGLRATINFIFTATKMHTFSHSNVL